MSRLWQLYAWGTIALTLVLLGVVAYWYFYPYEPLVVGVQPLPVIEEKLRQGQTLHYEVTACKYTTLPAHVSRAFVDTVIYNTPLVEANNPSGCRTTRVGVVVPNIPPGTYHLENVYSYQVNPIRAVEVKVVTEDFEIIE